MARVKSKNKSFFLLILFYVCTSKIGTSFYMPSIASIANGLSTSIDKVQFCMSIYMFGVAISQLIYGPLSEVFGRRIIMLIGFVIMFLGSLIGVFADNIDILSAGRFVEGIGAGACYALWRAIARDKGSGTDLAKDISYLAMAMIIIVPIIPVLGGYMDDSFGWRSNFILMSFFLLFVLVYTYFSLEETNIYTDRSKFNLQYIYKNYAILLSSKKFIYLSFGMFLFYGGFFSWLLVGSVILIKKMGMSPTEFGWINFFVLGGTRFITSYINTFLVSAYGTSRIIRLGCIISLFGGLILFALLYLHSLSGLLIGTILYFIGMSLFSPNTLAESFTPFGERAGYAAALYGSIQIGGASFFGMIVSYLPDETPVFLSIIFIFCSSLAWVLFEKSKNQK